MDQNEFSAAMQEAYRQALDNADAIVRNAEKVREEAVEELRLAREKHKEAESQAEQLVADYYEQKRRQFTEAIRLEQMRNLVRYHIEDGKSTDEIVSWLHVKPEFVKAIREVVQRVEALRRGKSKRRQSTGEQNDAGENTSMANGGENTRPERNARVTYSQSGRGGTVTFTNNEISFEMWWEFAGGGATAIVAIPTEEEWERKTRLPLARRMDVIHYIAAQILRDQFSRGHFLIGDSVITFYS